MWCCRYEGVEGLEKWDNEEIMVEGNNWDDEVSASETDIRRLGCRV